MPISREEFESGDIDLESRILDVLADDPSQALTLAELTQALEARLSSEVRQEVLMPGLRALEAGGKIVGKQIWNTDYWILKEAQ